MTEPTTDELARIGRRWSSYAGMGEPRSADDYDDAGCRILAEAAFRDVPALLALVAAQAEQIAELRGSRVSGVCIVSANFDASKCLHRDGTEDPA